MSRITMQDVEIYLDTRTEEAWSSVARAIPKGFPCVVLTDDDKVKLKIGDGVKTYEELPFVGGEIDLSNYYTKQEADFAISKAISGLGKLLKLKGTVATADLLPKEGQEEGDVWFVGSDVNDYQEYYWSGTHWDPMGKIIEIDLSDYYKKSEVNDLLNNKVDVRAGYGLSKNDFSDSYKDKLDGLDDSSYVKVTDTLILNCQLSGN